MIYLSLLQIINSISCMCKVFTTTITITHRAVQAALPPTHRIISVNIANDIFLKTQVQDNFKNFTINTTHQELTKGERKANTERLPLPGNADDELVFTLHRYRRRRRAERRESFDKALHSGGRPSGRSVAGAIGVCLRRKYQPYVIFEYISCILEPSSIQKHLNQPGSSNINSCRAWTTRRDGSQSAICIHSSSPFSSQAPPDSTAAPLFPARSTSLSLSLAWPEASRQPPGFQCALETIKIKVQNKP